MKKDLIERYISFGIESGYQDFDGYGKVEVEENMLEVVAFFNIGGEQITQVLGNNVLEIITSKEFIESIARGILYNGLDDKEKIIHKDFNIKDYNFTREIDKLTVDQAIAIRDDSLDEFITKLLNLGNH